jgi:hypothetical protein
MRLSWFPACCCCCCCCVFILITIHFAVFHGLTVKAIKHAEGQEKDVRSLIHKKMFHVFVLRNIRKVDPLTFFSVYSFS